MAEVAQRLLGTEARIEVAAFEDAEPPVDVVVCATAFHWLDPAVRLEGIAAVVRPHGVVAIVWTRHVRGGTQAFFDAAQSCYRRFGGNDPTMDLLDEADVEPRTAEFARSALFEELTSRRFAVETDYSTGDYLDLQRTYSDTIALPDERRDGLLRCLGSLLDRSFGGTVTKRTVFDLVHARVR